MKRTYCQKTDAKIHWRISGGTARTPASCCDLAVDVAARSPAQPASGRVKQGHNTSNSLA